MREILFRGNQYYGKGWVQGYYIMMGSAHQIYDGEDWCYVDPKTVGEWTGLKDKNDKLVFEGDIIEFDKPHGDWGCLAEIIFENGSYMYKPITDSKKVWNCIFVSEETPFSIIGNIHNNPGLLEK